MENQRGLESMDKASISARVMSVLKDGSQAVGEAIRYGTLALAIAGGSTTAMAQGIGGLGIDLGFGGGPSSLDTLVENHADTRVVPRAEFSTLVGQSIRSGGGFLKEGEVVTYPMGTKPPDDPSIPSNWYVVGRGKGNWLFAVNPLTLKKRKQDIPVLSHPDMIIKLQSERTDIPVVVSR